VTTQTIPPPHNILVSFAYYSRYDLNKLESCRIACDSGAISVRRLGMKIETKQLVAWAKTYWHRMAWIASLDVSGDPDVSRRNWNEMVDAGVPGIPTIHLREPPETMDYYVAQGVDFMGLGGMALVDCSPQDKFRWMVACFKYARENHPQVRFHGWGLANLTFLRLPFFSVDSSGWGAGYRYGRLQLRDPLVPQKKHTIHLNGKGTYSQEIACLLRDHYGVNPSEVSTSGPHNRLLMVRLSALSASVQEQHVRYLHRKAMIEPPTWGRLGGWDLPDGPNQHLSLSGCGAGIRERKILSELHGPHLHLVDGHPQHIETVARLARGEEIFL
jgi:hypothetical protein